MRRNALSLFCIVLILASLSACAPAPAQSTPPVPTVSGTPTPVAEPEPLTEEEVRAQIERDGDLRVLAVKNYEGDFLVEAGSGLGKWRGLYWVFRDTGMRVWLNREISERVISSYRVITPGVVEITTTGENVNYPVRGHGRVYTATLAIDSNGRILEGFDGAVLSDFTPHGGWLLLDGEDVVNGNPVFDGGISERYEQLYDVRLGVDGISFSFMPSGDPERHGSFFPACTSVPNIDCTFDPDTRIFTIRLYNTSLESGELADEQIEPPYRGLYPHTIPAGSLGADGHFFKDASIVQDGEDAVVTLTLTDAAYAYEENSGNMGNDDFPFYRVTFREHVDYMDE